MKHFALLCILLIFVHYSMQVPQYENCQNEVLPQADRQKCVKVICTSQNKYRIEECSCGSDAGLHLGERHSEYPVCCPRCSGGRH